jgi:hypothetical protein
MVTGSLRASLRPSSRKLTPSMISMPQNDMKHIGHVGFDGVVIGDVPFLSSNRSPSIASGLSDLDTRPSTSSLPGNGNKGSALKSSLFGSSVSSSSIFTGPTPIDFSKDEADTTCNFSDLKLPDLSDELNFGGSLFDEVMAALNVALSNRGVPTEESTSAKDEESVQGNNITTASSDSTIVAESHSGGHPSDSEDDHHHHHGKLSSSPGPEVSEGREHLSRGEAKFTSPAYASSRIPITYC